MLLNYSGRSNDWMLSVQLSFYWASKETWIGIDETPLWCAYWNHPNTYPYSAGLEWKECAVSHQSCMVSDPDSHTTVRHLWYFFIIVFTESNNKNKKMIYTKSLVNTNSFYTNFTNTHFQKVPIPHLTRTMKQKFLHYHAFLLMLY